MFVDENKKSKDDKAKMVKFTKGIAVAAGGVGAIGRATSGIIKLMKSSDPKKEDHLGPVYYAILS